MPATKEELVNKWARSLGGGRLVRAGNSVQTLVDGEETFAAMFRELLTARAAWHYIYLLGWYMDDSVPLVKDVPTSTILEIFKSAAASQVQIRVMLWEQVVGSDERKTNKTSVENINVLKTGAAILDGHTPTVLNSHHQKILVIKGERGLVAFCGGIDINGDRIRVQESPEAQSSSGQNGSPFHDVHCRIAGRAAIDLLGTFIQRWKAHPDTKAIDARARLLGYGEAPPSTSAGNAFVRVTRTYNCAKQRPERGQPTPSVAGDTNESVPSDVQSLKNICAKERSVRETLLASIATATRFIYIEEQYLIDLEVAAALKKALAHLQHITILIPHFRITRPWVMKGRRKSFIEAITGRADVPDKTSKFAVFYRVSSDAGTLGPHSYVHAKTWIFDDEMMIIGSANCNRRGLTSDSEANVCIFDKPTSIDQPSLAHQLRMRLWAEHLGLPASTVTDGVKSRGLWFESRPGSRVRPYDPTKGPEQWAADAPAPESEALVRDPFDPDYGDLPKCQDEDCKAGNYNH
jgi:phosphatidylserine/phosphatidylglycerophosphate/cardiolipin synthase-like enzyme